MWLIDKEKNWAMSCIPKNGSTSLREIMPIRPTDNEFVLDIPTRIVWLRDPFDRLVSNYSFFKDLNDRGVKNGGPSIEATVSWEMFIDYVLEQYNDHWGGQVEQVTHEGQYLGTVTHRFEDINKLWSLYYRGRIPRTNGIIHEPVAMSYRLDELNDKYKEDIELWSGL